MLIFNIQGVSRPQAVARKVNEVIHFYDDEGEFSNDISYLSVQPTEGGEFATEMSLKYGLKIRVSQDEGKLLVGLKTANKEWSIPVDDTSEISEHVIHSIAELAGGNIFDAQIVAMGISAIFSAIFTEIDFE